ncbi:MAG TPA: phosphoribosyltransferase family protein [bacterium]|nr:phosphoribosyltransferase family protein [bacterium]
MIPEGFTILIDQPTIAARIREMATALLNDIGEQPVTFVGILDGALFFMTDLIRAVGRDVQIDFLRISSYGGGMESGELKMLSGLTWNIAGRQVILVDDILDSGKTLAFCESYMHKIGAAGVRSAVLLAKEREREYLLNDPLIGFTIPDKFVIGYGMDWEGRFRHLQDIYHLEKQ